MTRLTRLVTAAVVAAALIAVAATQASAAAGGQIIFADVTRASTAQSGGAQR
jgi:hypothetical protein